MQVHEAVIGLEVHAQLLTRTKLFCACGTEFGRPPNTQVCPVCLGHPGTLPVVNARAVELGLRMGFALGGTIQALSRWERKHYFYPDLPKGYQISQYREPLVTGGSLEIEGRTIRTGRLHLEEDAGKSLHPEEEGGGESRVDLNRCGVPLLEIVCDPDIRSPAEAHTYLVNLKQILQYCEVCSGEMETGSLRCDANISLRPRGQKTHAPKTEVKNLNSFRNVERALTFEIGRQTECLRQAQPVQAGTYLWDQVCGRTRLMRSKEEAPDYRYFPEPDLPPLVLEPQQVAAAGAALPELPAARSIRFEKQYEIRPYDAQVLTGTRELADYYEAVVADLPAREYMRAANFLTTEVLARLREGGSSISAWPVAPAALAELLCLRAAGRLSDRLAREVLTTMIATGAPAAEVVARDGLEQVSDDTRIARWAAETLDAHPEEVRAYLAGKAALLGFFMGQAMRRSGGKADPRKLEAHLLRILDRRGK